MPTLYAAMPESVPVIRCSPPSWAAQLALLEEGLPHDVVWLRFDRSEHRAPEMLAIHPGGTVPVLVDGDVVLVDTIEILEHIVGRSAHGRLRAEPTLSGRRAELARAVKESGMAALRAHMRDPSDDAFEPLRQALDRWERHLAHDRVAADTFDLPALLVLVYVITARSLGLSTERWRALEASVERARRRPSVVASWPDTWRESSP